MSIKKLIEKISDNWTPKVICLALAVFIYIFHQVAILDRKSFSVPLGVVSEGLLMPSTEVPAYVRVTVRTKADNISSISSSRIKASINLDEYTEKGKYSVPVNITLSSELLLMDPLEISVKPEVLNVVLDEKIQKYIPVEPVLSGNVEHGYKISSVDTVPSTVKVIGPSKIVEKLKFIYTDKVNVKGAATGFTAEVGLDNQTSLVSPVPESKFKVTVVVEAEFTEKKYENFPLQLMNLDPDLVPETVLPAVSFKAEGTVSLIEKLQESDFAVYADCSRIKTEGQYELPVFYASPVNVSVKEKSMETFMLSIAEKKDGDSAAARHEEDAADDKDDSSVQDIPAQNMNEGREHGGDKKH